ncbi:hypothetical protein D3C73_648890 [compost metagenome]
MICRRLAQRSKPSPWTNACNIDGTKCRVLTRYCSIRLTSCAGSRWAPGSATASRAPVISGQKNSQTDTSKLNGVFCKTVSRPSSG